jgi:hypothetical protein
MTLKSEYVWNGEEALPIMLGKTLVEPLIMGELGDAPNIMDKG